MKNETRKLDGGVLVERYNILTTDLWAYTAWEPLRVDHCTIGSFEGGRSYGKLASVELPAELEALPARSEERSRLVHAWQEGKYEAAYMAILVAFPEAERGRRLMGDIRCTEREVVECRQAMCKRLNDDLFGDRD